MRKKRLSYDALPISDHDRRFLRARNFDLALSKKMIKDCQEWRRTVEGIGIDELYRQIDPFDASVLTSHSSYSIDLYIVSRARSCLRLLASLVSQGLLRAYSTTGLTLILITDRQGQDNCLLSPSVA